MSTFPQYTAGYNNGLGKARDLIHNTMKEVCGIQATTDDPTLIFVRLVLKSLIRKINDLHKEEDRPRL